MCTWTLPLRWENSWNRRAKGSLLRNLNLNTATASSKCMHSRRHLSYYSQSSRFVLWVTVTVTVMDAKFVMQLCEPARISRVTLSLSCVCSLLTFMREDVPSIIHERAPPNGPQQITKRFFENKKSQAFTSNHHASPQNPITRVFNVICTIPAK